jgi:hypothetical protein
MRNAFAVGAQIEHQGLTGTVSFICEEYLTLCLKPPQDGMTGPVCLCIYNWDWDKINVVSSHHS